MNNRERVLATLHHTQPDRVPYNIGFTQKARAIPPDAKSENIAAMIDVLRNQ